MGNIWLSLGLSTLLAALAVWKKAITPLGIALAWCFSVIISFWGGLTGFVALAATFAFTIAAGKLSGKIGESIGKRLHEKSGRRDAAQIFCNVGTGSAMVIVYAVTGNSVFLCAFGGAMASSLADSMASELGVLSKRAPVDICTMRPVTAGISGGVTLLGLSMSLLGAAIIGGICCLYDFTGIRAFIGITLAGFFGALADSVMGSALQAKYRCPVCGELTEKKRHCGADGSLEKGLGHMTNDAVNFLNNVVAAVVALLIC